MNYEKGAPYKQEDKHFVHKLKRAYHTKNILSLLLNNFDPSQEISVLEFGPGLGIMADILHQNYPAINYTAIDIDLNILENISNKYPATTVEQIESSNSLVEFLTDKKFDLIIALDVWEHIPRAEIDLYTQKSIECLNEKGLFVAQVPNCGCPFAVNVSFAGDITHCNLFNEISAKQLLLGNGAKSENIQILPYNFPLNGLINFFRTLIRPCLLIIYKLFLFLLGLRVLKICTPNLIMLIKKQ